jgi:ribonuclease HI
MDEVYSSRPDLMEVPLLGPELELFTDGSSFVQGRQRKAGFAVTTANNIIQAEALPQEWSVQQPELWALAQALRYAKGKQVNIYTDSKHALATLHVHGAI